MYVCICKIKYVNMDEPAHSLGCSVLPARLFLGGSYSGSLHSSRFSTIFLWSITVWPCRIIRCISADNCFYCFIIIRTLKQFCSRQIAFKHISQLLEKIIKHI